VNFGGLDLDLARQILGFGDHQPSPRFFSLSFLLISLSSSFSFPEDNGKFVKNIFYNMLLYWIDN
jgi:hypothetical protein